VTRYSTVASYTGIGGSDERLPHPGHWVGAEHVVGELWRDAEHVVAANVSCPVDWNPCGAFLDQSGQACRGGLIRQDPVGVAMDEQDGTGMSILGRSPRKSVSRVSTQARRRRPDQPTAPGPLARVNSTTGGPAGRHRWRRGSKKESRGRRSKIRTCGLRRTPTTGRFAMLAAQHLSAHHGDSPAAERGSAPMIKCAHLPPTARRGSGAKRPLGGWRDCAGGSARGQVFSCGVPGSVGPR